MLQQILILISCQIRLQTSESTPHLLAPHYSTAAMIFLISIHDCICICNCNCNCFFVLIIFVILFVFVQIQKILSRSDDTCWHHTTQPSLLLYAWPSSMGAIQVLVFWNYGLTKKLNPARLQLLAPAVKASLVHFRPLLAMQPPLNRWHSTMRCNVFLNSILFNFCISQLYF